MRRAVGAGDEGKPGREYRGAGDGDREIDNHDRDRAAPTPRRGPRRKPGPGVVADRTAGAKGNAAVDRPSQRATTPRRGGRARTRLKATAPGGPGLALRPPDEGAKRRPGASGHGLNGGRHVRDHSHEPLPLVRQDHPSRNGAPHRRNRRSAAHSSCRSLRPMRRPRSARGDRSARGGRREDG